MLKPLIYKGNELWVLDQRRLPHEEEWLCCSSATCVAEVIRDMAVRGAPAIGVAAAYGYLLGARRIREAGGAVLPDDLRPVHEELAAARPTAVNLAWALERMAACLSAGAAEDSATRLQRLADEARAIEQEDVESNLLMGQYGAAVIEPGGWVLTHCNTGALERMAACLSAGTAEDSATRLQRLADEARAIEQEDVESNLLMGQYGAAVIEPGGWVLTHCNTGALATAGQGTALGVVRDAWSSGRLEGVYVDETRPWLQGARLTAWELAQEGIPYRLICDSAAASVLATGRVAWVIVGADRIAANGDTANKIGTYSLAVLARHHGVKFMVVAPRSTIDRDCPDGQAIEIEQRPAEEVRTLAGRPVAPADAPVENPAFDVTPAGLIDVLVTEAGVVRHPDRGGIARLFD